MWRIMIQELLTNRLKLMVKSKKDPSFNFKFRINKKKKKIKFCCIDHVKTFDTTIQYNMKSIFAFCLVPD